MSLKRTDGIQAKCDIVMMLHNLGAYYPLMWEAKRSDLAKALEIGERTFIRHVSELSESGLLIVGRAKQHKPSAYSLPENAVGLLANWLMIECGVSCIFAEDDNGLTIIVRDIADELGELFNGTD